MTEISLEKAEQIAARIEAANKMTEELANRMEKLKVQDILGGKSEAGIIPPPVNKEEEFKNNMRKYFKGSALESAIK